MESLQEAYQAIYYNENNLYEDIVNFCIDSNIFETIDETEYFSGLIIENDLALTFIEDVLQYYGEEELLDESYITEVSAGLLKAGLRVAGGALKKAAEKGLSAKTLVKKGFRPTGLSSKGRALSGAAKADDIARTQAARAARKPPEAPKANRYADMLAQKKASQASIKPSPTPSPSRSSKSSAGSYIAKRGITDTLATTLALGMGHMAGIKPATNVLRQMAQPVVQSVGKISQRVAPRVAGKKLPDPWNLFPKSRKNMPKQYGLPKEGPSSTRPNRVLPPASSEPAGLLPAAKPAPAKPKLRGAADNPWNYFMKKKPRQYGLPKEGPSSPRPNRVLGPASQKPAGLLPPAKGPSQQFRDVKDLISKTGGGMIGTRNVGKPSSGAPKPAWGPGSKPDTRPETAAPKVIPGPKLTGTTPLKAQKPTPSGLPEPTKGAGKPPKGNIGALGAAAAAAKMAMGNDEKKKTQYNVYNTQDPSGRIRNRLAVGPKIVGDRTPSAIDFDKSYEKAKRTSGMGSKFKWRGGDYEVR